MRRVSLVVASLAAAAAVAQVPSKVGYQGRLLKSDGSPEAGIVDMTFSVYDVATGGVALGCDKAQVAVADGFYSVFLGDVGGCPGGGTAIAPTIFDGRELYLELTVGLTAMSPRQRIATVPYAHRAGAAVNVRGGTVEATSAQIGGPGGFTIDATGVKLGVTTVIDATGKVLVATGAGLSGDGSSASPLRVASDGVSNVMLALDAASLAKVSAGAMAAAGGNVGIGTSSPGAKLHVVPAAGADPYVKLDTPEGHSLKLRASGLQFDTTRARTTVPNFDNGDLLLFNTAAPATVNKVSEISFGSTYPGSGFIGAKVGAQYTNSAAAGGSDTDLYFQVSPRGEAVRIKSTGNVGIGTTSPVGKLHVAAIGDAVVIRPNAMVGGDVSKLVFSDPDSGTLPMSIEYKDDGTADLAIIGGSVGVGTTTPSARLDVTGGNVTFSTTTESRTVFREWGAVGTFAGDVFIDLNKRSWGSVAWEIHVAGYQSAGYFGTGSYYVNDGPNLFNVKHTESFVGAMGAAVVTYTGGACVNLSDCNHFVRITVPIAGGLTHPVVYVRVASSGPRPILGDQVVITVTP